MDNVYFISNMYEFSPWSFIYWRFLNDISQMLIHKIWIYFAQLFCNFTLPTSQFHFAKWWSPSYYLAILWNRVCRAVKSTLPNHRVNSAQLSNPCCQVSIPKLPIPHHQGHIAKLSSPNLLCELPTHSIIIFQVC